MKARLKLWWRPYYLHLHFIHHITTNPFDCLNPPCTARTCLHFPPKYTKVFVYIAYLCLLASLLFLHVNVGVVYLQIGPHFSSISLWYLKKSTPVSTLSSHDTINKTPIYSRLRPTPIECFKIQNYRQHITL